jgi:hypothetical protein
MRGVQNDIDHLQRVRRSRDAAAQEAIDRAIEQAQAWLDKMNNLLYGQQNIE